MLSREKVWSSWKNEGCPDWLASKGERQLKAFKKQDVEHYDPTKIDLGNKALNALWNFSPDNLSACRDPKRNFIPSVEEVIEEALDHADPEQGVEAEYSCFNNEVWQWKNNRLFLTEADSYLVSFCLYKLFLQVVSKTYCKCIFLARKLFRNCCHEKNV